MDYLKSATSKLLRFFWRLQQVNQFNWELPPPPPNWPSPLNVYYISQMTMTKIICAHINMCSLYHYNEYILHVLYIYDTKSIVFLYGCFSIENQN